MRKLESQVEQQGQSIKAMKREVEEATRRLGLIQGSFVVVSDFLAASSIVDSHDTRIISLFHAVMRAFAAESI